MDFVQKSTQGFLKAAAKHAFCGSEMTVPALKRAFQMFSEDSGGSDVFRITKSVKSSEPQETFTKDATILIVEGKRTMTRKHVFTKKLVQTSVSFTITYVIRSNAAPEISVAL